MAKGDSGASTHYIQLEDAGVLQNKQKELGPLVHQPDNTGLWAEGSGQLPISTKLSKEAQRAYILPNLKSASLIALGKLCDDKCKVVLSKEDLVVVKDN